MTKLEYVLSGKGEKKQRAIYAAFCISENSEEINNYYFGGFVADYPFPNICLDILKKEYGKRIDSIKATTLFEMISAMIQTQTDSSYFESEIRESIEDFMAN